MDIIGDRKFIEIPGDKLHQLPPLLVRSAPNVKRLDKVVGMANEIIQSEDLIPEASFMDGMHDADLERRKMDMAISLVDQYLGLIAHWQWGDGILEWIRQCETTFDTTRDLHHILRSDIWPHASRSSFVTLLHDKAVQPDGVEIDKAVGLRLTFRQPPPIACFSNQFLFYLNSTLAATAYQTWTHMAPDPVSSLPPERFTFQIYTM